jgi:hypothetical protein
VRLISAGREKQRNLVAFSERVLQAQGMVSVQTGCSFGEAIVLLRERARVEGKPLERIASDVVKQRIRFDAREGAR